MRVLCLVGLSFVASCSAPESSACTLTAQCDLSTGGVCRADTNGDRWCAYPDISCPSELRWSAHAGGGQAAACVVAHTVEVSVDGDGSGKVTSMPDGVDC